MWKCSEPAETVRCCLEPCLELTQGRCPFARERVRYDWLRAESALANPRHVHVTGLLPDAQPRCQLLCMQMRPLDLLLPGHTEVTYSRHLSEGKADRGFFFFFNLKVPRVILFSSLV